MEEYTNYLAHFGIKGMRWGIRRFQNPDGTLTLSGRRRYGVKPKVGESLSKRDKQRASKYRKEGTPVYYKRRFNKQKVVRRREAEKLDSIRRSNPKNLSDDELKAYTDRLKLENNYLKELTTRAEYSKGKTAVDNIIDRLETVKKVTVPASTIASNIRNIKKKENKEQN